MSAFESLTSDDVIIPVMGVTGAGKSTFISKSTDIDVGVGHSLTSQTVNVDIFPYQHDSTRRVFLVDTPGFDDTNRSDTEVLKELAFFLTQIYAKRVQMAGVLYLHRITDNRVSGAAHKNLRMFRSLCGKGALGHVLLATTMWDQMQGTSTETAERREKELLGTSEFWGEMSEGGSQVARWAGTKESARDIISKIIDVHTKDGTAVLKIQEEMVKTNLSLEETAAGQEVEKEMLHIRAQLQDQIKSLREEQEEMKRQSKDALAKKLALQQEQFEKQLEGTNMAQQSLKVSLERLVEQKEAEYRETWNKSREDYQKLREEVSKKDAELRRMQQDHQEMSEEARRHFESEMERVHQEYKATLKEQEQLRAEGKSREAEECQKTLDEQKKEMAQTQEVIDEAEKQKQEEEEKLAKEKAKIEKKEKLQKMGKSALSLLSILAGLGTTAAGVATRDKELAALGAKITKIAGSSGH